jgi:two-component system, chemotaxis family, protein-glutamate methylesterase/glutaminase
VTSTTILICDDSRTYATALRSLLEQDSSLEVVGISPSGEHALAAIKRLRPALVTMDLELPGMNGVEAIEKIMRSQPVPVVVLSAHAQDGSRKATAALAAGAVDVLPKTGLRVADPDGRDAATLRRRIKLLAQARVAPARNGGAPLPRSRLQAGSREVAAIGIGASTGGPRALRSVLSALPDDFAVPVLVVQHIGDEFLASLTQWLDEVVSLPVRMAVDGAVIGPGVWLAPDAAHLTIDRSLRVVLDRRAHSGPHCPSVDVMFESMASALGPHGVAVVLTGMGADGADGVAAITAAGGLALAQDEASSVVFGMPRAAATRGAQLLPIDDISPTLRKLRCRSVPV